MELNLKIPSKIGGHVGFSKAPFYQYPAHFHEELELNLVVSGRARYLLGQRSFDLQVGTLIWLFPGQQHILLDRSSDFSMWLAIFNPTLIKEFCSKGTDADTLQLANPVDDCAKVLCPRERSLLIELCTEIESFSEEPNLYHSGLACLLRMAWKRWNTSMVYSNFSHVHPAVEKAVKLLHKNPSLSLPELAAQSGLSRSQLSRTFKVEIGHSVSSFRNHCRVQLFLEYYASDKLHTMLDCALEAGFGSYEQFLRVFKQQLGCTPSDYKKHSLSDVHAAPHQHR